jgi:hypothetical protein
MAVPNKSLLIRAGLVVLTLVLGLGAYALGTNLVMDGREVAEAPPGTTPDETVTFTDEEAGIKLSYPEDWAQIENNSKIELTTDEDTQVRLIAGPDPDKPALKVRVVPLPEEIVYDPDMSANDLGVIQGTLDKLIVGPNVEILSRRPINDKGKLGFHYLYAFKQESTGREGAHSHYFIFDGAKMNVLIFEALPRDEFDGMASTFDAILESFTSERRAAPAASPSPSPAP